MNRLKTMTALAFAGAIFLAGCGDDSASLTGEEGDAGASAEEFSLEPAKDWVVDTSGWWVPEDPSGCLDETTECMMAAWPVRERYRSTTGDGIILDAFKHGDTISLYCKGPTPEAIRNSRLTESVYWYYADYNGTKYWVPDIYVTLDDVDGMADGVPDCPSNTPGVNGRGS